MVALSANGSILAQQVLPESRRQAAMLQPVIAAVCATAGKELASLEAVSVVSGPGSYTGLRVGLAAAKGLCFARNIPLIMPDRLLLLALSIPEVSAGGSTWIAVPARTAEWFSGCFQGRNTLVAPRHWEEADFQQCISQSNVNRIGILNENLKETDALLNDTLNILNIKTLNSDSFAKESEFRYVNKITESVPNSTPLYLKSVFTTSPTVKKIF